MKKSLFFILGLSVLLGITPSVFADGVNGPVQSIDASKNEIIVKDSASGANKAVSVHPKIISTLQPGSVVKVSLKPGTNAANTVEVEMG